ncbi:DUF4168 domain-containing protein [Thermosynechococcus sp. PP45]|uniref:DUF4168 domain-containing protein n=1 Tax=unclassified Thermosynechococcus TaxID=2622553 RepID=UPI002673118E|nr:MULTISPECIES: DUF4168 domain-containing protein [unclassified Thermosynechococcus]WKT81263.1 DUF4168 domain-containing protein [Thermosynechococcus sp. PP45]WNC24874.1 DUF4168 domain-containing protein [Thermosynechococcus sp. PP551]WNC27451.1 DUF4168 domain-containing protein [Thermosynechococcus sp. PP555]
MSWKWLPLAVCSAGLLLVPVPSPHSLAQTSPRTDAIAPWEIMNYARVVLEIEPIRQKYYRQAQVAFQGQVPRNSCFGMNPQNIPSGLETICANYVREAMQVLRKYNMSLERFNAITLRAQQDSALSQRIQAEMVRLQRP